MATVMQHAPCTRPRISLSEALLSEMPLASMKRRHSDNTVYREKSLLEVNNLNYSNPRMGIPLPTGVWGEMRNCETPAKKDLTSKELVGQRVCSPGHSTAAPQSPHRDAEDSHEDSHEERERLYDAEVCGHSHHHRRVSQDSLESQPTTIEVAFVNTKGDQDAFTVCEHWCAFLIEALKKAREGREYRWISHYTVLHYAVSKQNQKMIEFLLEAPECADYFHHYVHVVDDFYQKPIDLLCNKCGFVVKAKQHMAEYLQYFMQKYPSDQKCEREVLYQDIKLHGPIHLRKEKREGQDIPKKVANKAIDFSNVASGETGVDLTNMMRDFEVEHILPNEMRKAFKIVAKSGFDNYLGSWAKGESPLHWAASRGKVDVCRYLVIMLKADPEVDDDKGRSAIKLAKTKKHHALAKMLHTKDFPVLRDHQIQAQKEKDKKNVHQLAPKLSVDQ